MSTIAPFGADERRLWSSLHTQRARPEPDYDRWVLSLTDADMLRLTRLCALERRHGARAVSALLHPQHHAA